MFPIWFCARDDSNEGLWHARDSSSAVETRVLIHTNSPRGSAKGLWVARAALIFLILFLSASHVKSYVQSTLVRAQTPEGSVHVRIRRGVELV